MMLKIQFTLVSFLVLFALAAPLRAQNTEPHEPRFEAGGHIYGLGGNSENKLSDSGLGARFTYNFHKYVSLDTEANLSIYLDGDGERDYSQINGAQVFAGIKAGKRVKRVGVFAKARPGLVTNFHEAVPNNSASPYPFDSKRLTLPALDVGGVFELYFADRKGVFRVDASDLIIPFDNKLIREAGCPCPFRLGTTHTFRLSFGLGVRF